jgi:hypothetical protein
MLASSAAPWKHSLFLKRIGPVDMLIRLLACVACRLPNIGTAIEINFAADDAGRARQPPSRRRRYAFCAFHDRLAACPTVLEARCQTSMTPRVVAIRYAVSCGLTPATHCRMVLAIRRGAGAGV